MTGSEDTRGTRRRVWVPAVLGLLGLAALGLGLRGVFQVTDAAATSGPCNPVQQSPGVQAQSLLSTVNQWRASNLSQPPMGLSAVASHAAQWFAEDMIAGQTAGHTDQYGRIWAQRLADCGFNAYWSQGSGEALAGFGSSDPNYGSTVDQALNVMTVNTPDQNGVEAPIGWKCAGVGYAANPNASVGQDTYAWVVVTVQTGADGTPNCDTPMLTSTSTSTSTSTATASGSATGTPVTVTPSSTATATPSPTASPTPSPTHSPTPTPETYTAYAPMIARD